LPGLQLKNALVIVTLSVLLSAGAHLHAQPLAPQVAKDGQKPTAASKAVDKNVVDDKSAEPLPSVELSEDLLFRLLRAELAYQRGDWQLAYRDHAGGRATDPRSAPCTSRRRDSLEA
jgi:hypothetical protein